MCSEMHFANMHITKHIKYWKSKTGSTRVQLDFGEGGETEGKARGGGRGKKKINMCLTKHINEHGKNCFLFYTLNAVKENNEIT